MASIEQAISTYRAAMDIRVQRHQTLASNIANADTPNYKARDIDFSAAMQKALTGTSKNGAIEMTQTNKGHLTADVVTAKGLLAYRKETQSAVDGNTVDMDVERTQIADNALQYQVLTQLISEKFKGLRNAMSTTSS